MLLIDKLANHSNNYPKLDLSSKSLQLTASIVIPSYNSAKTLKIVVSQLLKQTAVKQIKEIIVIDDNSQDSTPKVMDEVIKSSSVQIIYKRNDIQCFSGECRNKGLNYATGDIIFFLDSDIAVSLDFIEKHLLLHQLIDKCFSFSFRSYISEEDFENHNFEFPITEYNKEFRLNKIIPEAWCETQEQKNWANKEMRLYEFTDGFRNLSSVNREYFWTLPEVALIGISAIKRKHIDAVGGFVKEFKGWGYEDIAFAAKLIALGLFAIPVLEVGTFHPNHPHRITDHQMWFKKNKELYYKFLNSEIG